MALGSGREHLGRRGGQAREVPAVGPDELDRLPVHGPAAQVHGREPRRDALGQRHLRRPGSSSTSRRTAGPRTRRTRQAARLSASRPAPTGQVTVGLPVNSPQQIGQLTPGGTCRRSIGPNGSDPFGVAFGADGAFWVAEFAGQRLARVTTDGQLDDADRLPGRPRRRPRQITVGPTTPCGPRSTTRARAKSTPRSPRSAASNRRRRAGAGWRANNRRPPAAAPDATPPAMHGRRPSPRRRWVPARRPVTVRFTVNEPGDGDDRHLQAPQGQAQRHRCVKPTPQAAQGQALHAPQARQDGSGGTTTAGANSVKLRIKTLTRGSYAVALTAADAAGNRTKPVTRTLSVTRKRSRRGSHAAQRRTMRKRPAGFARLPAASTAPTVAR